MFLANDADTSLLVFASDDASGQRYFNMTLEEMDKVSLVRDRTGSGFVAAVEERNDASDDDMSLAKESSPPPMTQMEKRGAARDAEWGVQRPSNRSSPVSSADSDEETEDERETMRQEEEEEEEEDYEEDDVS